MNNQKRLAMLKELTEVEAISGHERNAAKVFKKYITPFADEITHDNLGSVIALKKGSSKLKLMLAGHLDEVGFLVSKIENDGFIRLHPIGGWWTHVLLAQRLAVHTNSGKRYIGIVGSTAPHGMSTEQKSKVMDIKNVHLDLGLNSKEKVMKLGIRPGDMVVPVAEFFQLAEPKMLAAKAFDDRIGAAVVIEVLAALKNVKHKANVYSVGTVQEEVGLRGAKTSAFKINPDVAIAIDVTLAGDIPGAGNNAKLGDGVALSFADGSVIGAKELIYELEKIATEEKIKFSYDMLTAGGTDSGEIHKVHDGVLNCTLSIPSRYIHSHYSIIHQDDYEATINLIVAFIKRLDDKMLDRLMKQRQG
jgi:putative aminopeptidase FrvX